LGVRVAQGFHLGRPEPLTDLLARPQGAWMRRPKLMRDATTHDDVVENTSST
jgi:hypothetical protein